jgi:hypothetical protein
LRISKRYIGWSFLGFLASPGFNQASQFVT